jgi:signal transduction histidine kinase/HAMP domain-containing protein
VKPQLRRFGIRTRLWLALAFLAGATVFVGIIAWYALDRANVRLQLVHTQTMEQVARALDLSKESSDLATSAPYLLNLKSSYIIQTEGQKLLDEMVPVLQEWPSPTKEQAEDIDTYESEIAKAAKQMNLAIADLVSSASAASGERDRIRNIRNDLVRIEHLFYGFLSDPNTQRRTIPMWLALQAETNELIRASNAESMVNLGERRRRFQSMQREFAFLNASESPRQWAQNLADISAGDDGLFLVRRRDLAHRLNSQSALFRIRHSAAQISTLAAQFAENAKTFLAQQRKDTARSIAFAKVLILAALFASISIASLAALYVSSYVTRNIHIISEAMERLAAGDLSTRLRLNLRANDEVGKLHAAFRVFRANAFRLERRNRQLHQQNALFNKIFKHITAGVAITDEQGRIRQSNQGFSDIFTPHSEADSAVNIADVLAASPFAAQAESAGLKAGFRGAIEITGIDGRVLDLRCSRLPDGGGIWLFYDATERREMDNRLNKIKHIEGLSKLTGEVAHDFGNILAAVNSNVYLLQTGSRKTSPELLLQRISNAVDLGTSLTQRLLAFARQQALAPEVVELNELVEGLAELVQIGLKDEVDLKIELNPAPLHVKVDPGQLESAILNLCLNANQAMSGAGEITVSLHKAPQDNVRIIVQDTGCGMDEETLSHALEPFFTARADGEGTGLGLSMVYGFIKQTGGDIQIESTVGQGTTITLTLPLCSAAQPRPALSRTVLLVEDDPEMLNSVAAQLNSIGYAVERASTFEKAMAVLDSGQKPDALVTDLHLNDGKMAWDIVERCLKICPDTRILVTSGRLPRRHRFSDTPNPRVNLTSKPLSPAILKAALE